MTGAPVSLRLYHYLDAVHPWLAEKYAALVIGAPRTVIEASGGRFWIDPLSNFGRELMSGVDHEPVMRRILNAYLRPGAVFVDVGANEGYFSVAAAKQCAPGGRVIAVEPQPRCRRVIERNWDLNGIDFAELAACAVSDRRGSTVMFLHPATNTGATSTIRSSRLGGRRVTVECLTLSAVFERHRIGRADLVKVDIEGGEYEAVLGSPELFVPSRLGAVALEYHPEILKRRRLNPSDIHRFLTNAGYIVDQRFSSAPAGSSHEMVVYAGGTAPTTT
jgi:FkbM family methyltransferase